MLKINDSQKVLDGAQQRRIFVVMEMSICELYVRDQRTDVTKMFVFFPPN